MCRPLRVCVYVPVWVAAAVSRTHGPPVDTEWQDEDGVWRMGRGAVVRLWDSCGAQDGVMGAAVLRDLSVDGQ